MDAASKKQPVKVGSTMHRLALDVTLQCACGYKGDFLRNPDLPYLKAVHRSLKLTGERFDNSLYAFNWMYFLTPAGRKMNQTLAVLHGLTNKVIQSRKAARKNGDQGTFTRQSKYMDFLDTILRAVG